MKFAQFASFGSPPDVIECAEAPPAEAPGREEVIFDVEAFPINPADLLTIEGRYAVKPPLPATLGAECVGRVTAVGAGVGHLQVGDRVINLGRENWAQQKKVKATELIKVSGDVDPLQLAMLKVNPPTALLMLRKYVELNAGDWVIQNAANSAVGRCLVRLAKADGIRTVNVVRRESLVAPLKAIGADLVVMDGDDLAERVRTQTGNASIKLAIDAVGGTAITRLADCLCDGGTAVNYGLLSGENCQFTSHQLVFKQITATGFWLVKWLGAMSLTEIQNLYGELAGRIADGSLTTEVEAVYAIEDIKAAVAHAGRQARSGKILVTPNGPVA